MDKNGGKGVERHEIVTGVSDPLRQRRTQRATNSQPDQESQTTHNNGAQTGEKLPVQETDKRPDGNDRQPQYRAGRLVLNRLRDAWWHATMDNKQHEAKEDELESEKNRIEADKEKLERENEQYKTKKAEREQKLVDKQRELKELTSERDSKIAALHEKIEQLKSRAASAEKDRHDLREQHQVSEIEEKIQQCQQDIDELKSKLKECQDVIHKQECDIKKLEGKIEMLTELLDKYKDLFIVAKRRAICAHWCWGALAVVLFLALLVVVHVFFELAGKRFCGWYW